MVCLGLEHGAAGWKAQTNPLSHGGTPCRLFLNQVKLISRIFLSSAFSWSPSHASVRRTSVQKIFSGNLEPSNNNHDNSVNNDNSRFV